MNDIDKQTSPTPSQDLISSIPDNPGWKPLAWFLGSIALVIATGEVLLEYGWELLVLLGEGIFYVVEGSEEFLEDAVEGWFSLEPWEAEMVTAWSMFPVKLLLAFFVLRMLWRWKKEKVFPAMERWFRRQWLIIKLSWKYLWWPWKGCLVLAGLGVLVVLI